MKAVSTSCRICQVPLERQRNAAGRLAAPRRYCDEHRWEGLRQDRREKAKARALEGPHKPCEICSGPIVPKLFRGSFWRANQRFCSRACRLEHDRRRRGLRLVQGHLDLIGGIAAKSLQGLNPTLDRESLMQEAILRLGKRAGGWIPSKGQSLRTFLAHRTKHAVMDAIRAEHGRTIVKHQDQKLEGLKDPESLLACEDRSLELEDSERAVRRLIARGVLRTAKRERDIPRFTEMATRYVLGGESYSQIAEDFGVDGSRVCQIVKAATRAIREDAKRLAA